MTFDIDAAKRRAQAWLPSATAQPINEELLALDLLDATQEIERLRALVEEACDIGTSVGDPHWTDAECNRRLSAIRAEVKP